MDLLSASLHDHDLSLPILKMLHDAKEVTAIDQDCFSISRSQSISEANNLLSQNIPIDEIPRQLTCNQVKEEDGPPTHRSKKRRRTTTTNT